MSRNDVPHTFHASTDQCRRCSTDAIKSSIWWQRSRRLTWYAVSSAYVRFVPLISVVANMAGSYCRIWNDDEFLISVNTGQFRPLLHDGRGQQQRKEV